MAGAGMGWAGLGWAGLGLGWAGLDWAGLDWAVFRPVLCLQSPAFHLTAFLSHHLPWLG